MQRAVNERAHGVAYAGCKVPQYPVRELVKAASLFSVNSMHPVVPSPNRPKLQTCLDLVIQADGEAFAGTDGMEASSI